MTVFSSFARAAAGAGALAALAACATSGAALSPPDSTDPETAAIAARLDAAFSDLAANGFSGVVAVARDGDLVFAEGYGAADPTTGAPFTPDTQVGVGSIVKSFTGMAAADLIARGVISADDTLADFFPDAPADKAGITVQQLLTHSAGFPGAIGDDYEHIGRDAYVARALATELRFPPGDHYEYSNVGFSLVAAIIEVATGKSYEDFLMDDLLIPAGVVDTGYARAYDSGRVEHDQRGRPYAEASWGGSTPYWNLIGNGGIVSTARQMVNWRVKYAAGDIVSPEAVALAQTPYIDEGPSGETQYGYGLVVVDHPDFGRIYWHNGGNPFFTANWTDYAEHGFVVFAAENGGPYDADDVVLAATGALFDVAIRVDAAPVLDDDAWAAIPATPLGALATAFLDVVDQDDPAAWRAFIEAHATADFRAMAPMERHMEMFTMMHGDFGGTERLGAAAPEADRLVVRLRRPDTGEVFRVDIVGEAADGTARLAGLGVDHE